MSSLEQFETAHVKPRDGRTLIVGSHLYREKEDRRKRYADAIGLDMQDGPGVDVVQDLEESIAFSQVLSFDHVECMSVLEHSRRPWLMAANIERMMREGASIYVTVPFIWAHHGYPHDYWRMTPDAIAVLFPHVEWVATAFAHKTLEYGQKIKRTVIDAHPYFPRTETACFGFKR